MCTLMSTLAMYIGKDTQDILKQKGIEHHLTMPESAQQNRKAEWFNCTMMDKALAMQHTTGLSYSFWEFAVESAVHIYNCTPTHVLKWWTPYYVSACIWLQSLHACTY